ncbi:MAG: tetraacyldisaccharide 4'-kinase [Gemmatimonadaceae bacterium]
MRAIVNDIWFGDGAPERAGRAVLWLPERAFAAGVAVRNLWFNRAAGRGHVGPIPAISVGNITVGGTGKTPVAAWVAGELARRGVRPAIVLRGYGGDEPAVHARLNPDVPVVVDVDRVHGVRRAAALNADVAILDDAFQHRRAARIVDLVLVSAERGLECARMLPAGPFREPVSALRRATLVMVTRKTAVPERAAAVLDFATASSGHGGAIVSLQPESLVAVDGGETRPLSALNGCRVLLMTGVGEPALVASQLQAAGASVELRAFPDHHAFTDRELARVGRSAAAADYAVCTLKDAVKISTRWPGSGALWYVSQQVTVERGLERLEAALDRVIAAIPLNPSTAG